MPHTKTGIKRITLRNLELATVVALEGLEIRRVESGVSERLQHSSIIDINSIEGDGEHDRLNNSSEIGRERKRQCKEQNVRELVRFTASAIDVGRERQLMTKFYCSGAVR